MRKMEPHEYLLKHSQKLSEEYPGKYLAIVDDRVVAVSGSGHDAFEKAKKKMSRKGDLYNLHAHGRRDGDTVMRFPYMKLRGRDLPVIPLRIKGEDGWIIYNAFVDSGAGYSIFQTDVAEDLNLNLEYGEREYVTVGDGSLIIVYVHRLEI